MALRYDVGSLAAPTRMPNGHLLVEGHITRAGIFEYRNADGTVRREYRPATEVFDTASLSSFRLVPVTNDHPPELLTADNTKQYTVGTVGETVKQDGEHVRANMMITDADTIRDVEGGKAELSCGYSVDLEHTSGVWNGVKYDAIQRNIRGNHVAIVDRARAGRSAKMRLDRDDAAMIDVARNDGERTMKIIINGVEYEVTDQVAQAITRERADADEKIKSERAALASTKTELEKITAKFDAASASLVKVEKERTDAADPARFQARVRARVSLERQAVAVLGSTVKLDDDDHKVRLAVLGKLCPDAKFDGKSDVYVEARYDSEIERFEKSNPALDDARRAASGRSDDGDKKETRDDGDDPEEAARARMRKDNAEAYKRKQ